MPTKIAVICDTGKFSAKVQALGERINKRPVHPAMPYHCGWTDGENLWDMNWTFRKIKLDHYANRDIHLFDSPVEVTPEYLDAMVGKRKYGTFDVALNPILTPLGINWFGTHCAEAINDDLWMNSYRTPWIPYGTPPTPHQMLFWLEK
jgi:hypothetical protein